MGLSVSSIFSNVKAICGLEDSKREAVEAAIKSFGLALLESYEWSFLYSSDTDPSVVNQSQYTLRGAASDCGIVSAVYYDGVELIFKDNLEFNRLTQGITDNETAYPVGIWTWLPGSDATDGFPIIKLFGTPTIADDDIFYSYRKLIDEAEPLKHAPAAMADLIELETVSRFHPNPNDRFDFGKKAEKALPPLQKRYRKTVIAHRPGRIDPLQRARNYEINMLGGYRNVPHIITNR